MGKDLLFDLDDAIAGVRKRFEPDGQVRVVDAKTVWESHVVRISVAGCKLDVRVDGNTGTLLNVRPVR